MQIKSKLINWICFMHVISKPIKISLTSKVSYFLDIPVSLSQSFWAIFHFVAISIFRINSSDRLWKIVENGRKEMSWMWTCSWPQRTRILAFHSVWTTKNGRICFYGCFQCPVGPSAVRCRGFKFFASFSSVDPLMPYRALWRSQKFTDKG